MSVPLDSIQADYQAGQIAFERGDYRKAVQYLEAALAAVDRTSRLGGEIQIWLVTAYEAKGERTAAIDLCRRITQHPHYSTRQQGKRLLYILEAPKLQTRPEWFTQIPDLSRLSDSQPDDRRGSSPYRSAAPPPADFNPLIDPPDPNQRRENQFVWVALGLVSLILGGLWWWSQ